MHYSRLFLGSFLVCWLGCAPVKPTLTEYEHGLSASEQLIDRFGQRADSSHDDYLRYLKDRLTGAIPRKRPMRFQYEFILLEDPAPAAFSPGGGFILFSKGLIKSLANEAELAFVLSHEIAHQQLGHTALLISRPEALADRPYQRELELRADEYAVGLIALAGYDPRVCPFALTRSYRALDHIPLDAGYPDLDTRLSAIHVLLKNSAWQPPGTLDRRAFQQLRLSL